MTDQPNGVDLDAEIAALAAQLSEKRKERAKAKRNARQREQWRTDAAYRAMMNARTAKWRAANPEKFRQSLCQSNKKQRVRLRELVKLGKLYRAEHPEAAE